MDMLDSSIAMIQAEYPNKEILRAKLFSAARGILLCHEKRGYFIYAMKYLDGKFRRSFCADESCHDRHSLPDLRGKYDMVNIKLDKTGGLTEALALRDLARAEGYGVMVGCMVGSSLAMAPAVLVAQGAQIVDLDGPLLLAEDRENPLTYEAGKVYPPDAALWG